MKNIVKYLLSFLSRIYLFFTKNRVRVLAFHKVEHPKNFEKKLAFLKKNYNLIDVDQLREHIFHNKPLPSRSLLITFDDGDLSMHTNALPLFKKYHAPAVLFIITELIGTNKPFWWDEISYHLPGDEGLITRRNAKRMPNKERMQLLFGLRMDAGKKHLNSNN